MKQIILSLLLFTTLIGCSLLQDGEKNDSVPTFVPKINVMISVPQGMFQRDSEQNNISIISDTFSISKYEVTRWQFEEIMGTDPTPIGISTDKNGPIRNVSWYAAIAFCNKLSLSEGLQPVYEVDVVNDWETLLFNEIPTFSDADWNAVRTDSTQSGYRLPTEMEWMWAAMGAPLDGQGGDTNSEGYLQPYSGFEGLSDYGPGDYSWFIENSQGSTYPMTHTVGLKRPNRLGLHDMSGNVYEYCGDGFGNYPENTITDYRGNPLAISIVIRGGSFIDSFESIDLEHRNQILRYLSAENIGFRVAKGPNGASSVK